MKSYKEINEKIEEQLKLIEKLENWASKASIEDKIYSYEPKILNAYEEIQRIIKKEAFNQK